jgi:starvation-inducible DNA-binding protein
MADVAAALNALLADSFALYVKTKNFHWHMSGPHFRDYHLLLDEQADQVFAVIDPMAERVRKLGVPTLRSIGEIQRAQRILDSDAGGLKPEAMLRELYADNTLIAEYMRATHKLCDDVGDIATASLLEVWIDETDRRTWFLREVADQGSSFES